jgi:hypothetical protein
MDVHNIISSSDPEASEKKVPSIALAGHFKLLV